MNGTLNISIECDTIDKMDFVKHYSANILLQPQWQLFSVSFDSLSLYADENPDPDISWNDASKTVNRIEFNALEGDTVQLWLDDLTVEGMDFSSVY